ncbi:MAG: glycosyl hydrolase, partial [Thermoguttaceae bacterium]|nr:glycosyl hydrolase [Thermoguttaceae bacterium]
MGRLVVWVVVAGAMWTVSATAATLKPVGVEQFFVTPDQPAVLQWKVEGALGEPLTYRLYPYQSGREPILLGLAEVASERATASVKLAPGFYEIEFPSTQQRFGIVALPASNVPPDPFFAIDGALSWLVGDDATREGLVRSARRCGIGMIRERLTWGAVHPAADRWEWQGAVRFDTLRRTCQTAGVEVLEMAHDAPGWMGRVAKYPDDLIAASRSWQQIARRWSPTWGAVEIWNEPDIFFGGDLPADQYAALVRALAHGLCNQADRKPIVGGVVAHHNREFLETAAENGLLACIDAFSFHTYGRAMEMEPLVERYRDWLTKYGHPSMPLWITECGRPWKRGPGRPPADQDAASALDITMKAVEARACGVARYFAFVYPYYDENENNFGMMDKHATPLRSIAAYACAAHLLRGCEYVGDLEGNDRAIQRARVFRRGAETLAVIYTGKPDPQAKVKLPLSVPGKDAKGVARPETMRVVAALGIDGRSLALAPDGAVPVPDGLTYVRLDRLVQGAP